MTLLKQTWTIVRIVSAAVFAVATSPLVRRSVLFFAIFAAMVLGLLHLAGWPMTLFWKLLVPLLIFSVALAFRTLWNSKKFKVEGPQVYDKAHYHYDGDFPKGLPRRQAYVPTGMFIGWLVEHDLIDSEFLPETQGFKERKITGAKIYRAWDGRFTSQMLTDEGNRFAADYFDFEHGKYLEDFEAALLGSLPSIFHVADTWENYDLIRLKIDQRYEAWKHKPK